MKGQRKHNIKMKVEIRARYQQTKKCQRWTPNHAKLVNRGTEFSEGTNPVNT